jgi:hypothetical protein
LQRKLPHPSADDTIHPNCHIPFMYLESFSSMSILETNIQGVTERCGQTLGHKLHIPKEEKMSISTCVQKHLICEP